MTRRPFLALAALACLAPPPAWADGPPPLPREFRAAWVATVENIDWPTRPGLPTEAQKAEAVAILDQARDLRLNAMVLQVRTAADALYPSAIEPWSYYLTGEQGRPPEPFYDPLQFWIDEAHRRGLALHAWINPYRARIAAAKYADAASHANRARPEIVRTYGTARWLDPGEPDAFRQTQEVVADLARRYDLDGVHIDDYFYPYPIPDPDKPGQEVPFPDDPSWAKAQAGGFTGGRDDWRRQNINRLVEAMLATVRRERPTAMVGISPFGIPRPGQPAGVVGFDQYAKLYADAVLWLREGWCDYVAPQLYWKVDAPGQPFRPLLNYWIEQNPKGRHVWPGLSSSRVGTGSKGYAPDEVFEQMRIIRSTPGASGSILFSQKSLRANKLNLSDRLRAEVNAEPALIPSSPWLPGQAPGTPKLGPAAGSGGDRAVEIAAASGTAPFVWAVQTRRVDRWEFAVLPGSAAKIPFPEPADEVVVTAVDRLGKASEPQRFAGR